MTIRKKPKPIPKAMRDLACDIRADLGRRGSPPRATEPQRSPEVSTTGLFEDAQHRAMQEWAVGIGDIAGGIALI